MGESQRPAAFSVGSGAPGRVRLGDAV